MSKFKPGDRVVCVSKAASTWFFRHHEGLHLIEVGKKYVIKQYYMDGALSLVGIHEAPGNEWIYLSQDFELAGVYNKAKDNKLVDSTNKVVAYLNKDICVVTDPTLIEELTND